MLELSRVNVTIFLQNSKLLSFTSYNAICKRVIYPNNWGKFVR